jgi:cytochrome c oxidase subunit II
MAASEQDILRSELRWAVVTGGAVSLIFVAILYAGLILHVNPPSDIETIDPKTLQLSAEFTEANLGTKVEAGGQVTTRIVATQFAFDPPCVVVPSNEPVTLRLTSPDVIHGILAFLWRRRPRQHGLWSQRPRPQHLLGYGAFPSDFWRRGGDYVLCHCL